MLRLFELARMIAIRAHIKFPITSGNVKWENPIFKYVRVYEAHLLS